MPVRSGGHGAGRGKIAAAIDLGIGDIAAALPEAPDERLLFLARDQNRAAAVARAAFEVAGEILVVHLSGSDALPGDRAPASPQIAGQRTAAPRTLREGVAAGRRIRPISSGEVAGRPLAPPTAYDASSPSVKVGDTIDLDKLRTALLRDRARGGQSFVVVPRIADMEPLRAELARLVPELTMVEAHGKLAA